MKKRKKRKADLTQANRWEGRRAAVEMHAVEAQADLSLSLSLFSDVMRWNVLEVKKKIKRRGFYVSCVEEKNKKKKKEKKK